MKETAGRKFQAYKYLYPTPMSNLPKCRNKHLPLKIHGRRYKRRVEMTVTGGPRK
jgi:hypothetical protein